MNFQHCSRGVGTKTPPFSLSRKMVSILGIYMYLEGIFYQKELYIQKGEIFVKTIYYQDIRTISVNFKYSFWKRSFLMLPCFPSLFMKNKIHVSFHKSPPFAETDWAWNKVIFRPFFGHLINSSHSPPYNINIFHNLLFGSLKYTSRNISGQLSFDWLHVLKGYFTLCTKRRIKGTWQRKSWQADGRSVSGADEPQMASRSGGRSAIKERRSIKKTCAKKVYTR